MAETDATIDDLAKEVWRHKFVVLLAALVCAAGGVAYGLMAVKQYQVTITLSPVSDPTGSKGGGLASIASQYDDLASMAGFSMPNANNGKDESIAVLQSELLTEKYIQENDLLPVLYWRRWDAAAHKWNVTNPKKVPTLWKANQLFKGQIRSLSEDKKTGLVVMTIKWKDPDVAAKWANDLVALTNEYLRGKAIAEAERNIAYLNDEAARTNVVELRHALFSLLQQELNTEMMAKGRPEYALKVIDPARAPERPSSFGAAALGGIGAALGLFLSALYFVVRLASMRRTREP